MPSYYTILVGCRHFGVGSDLSAIASARELHPGVKPSTRMPFARVRSVGMNVRVRSVRACVVGAIKS